MEEEFTATLICTRFKNISFYTLILHVHYILQYNHRYKIEPLTQKTNLGKYSFCNHSIEQWNALPAKIFEPFPPRVQTFKAKLKKIVKHSDLIRVN